VLAFKPLKCPQCNECIHRLQLMKGECPFCHTDIGAARSYQRCIGLLTLVTIALLAVATHESTSGGAWLLGIFLSAIPCWIMFLNIVPPWLKRGHAQPRITLVSSWLGVALTVFLVEFMGFGALYVFFGSSRRELLEHLAMLSMPLAWISPNFLITPSRTFFDLCGIILGNSAFFGPLMYACYLTVRWAFRRSRPTQLSLSNSDPTTDDE
jgi:hypothetical protein